MAEGNSSKDTSMLFQQYNWLEVWTKAPYCLDLHSSSATCWLSDYKTISVPQFPCA